MRSEYIDLMSWQERGKSLSIVLKYHKYNKYMMNKPLYNNIFKSNK